MDELGGDEFLPPLEVFKQRKRERVDQFISKFLILRNMRAHCGESSPSLVTYLPLLCLPTDRLTKG